MRKDVRKPRQQSWRRRAPVVGLLVFLLLTAVSVVPYLLRLVPNDKNTRRGLSLPCIVLTQNSSEIDPSIQQCTRFSAPAFQESELDFVSAEAREKLLDSTLLETARDLSNNASVNIYMNHVRMWGIGATKQWDSVLLLEDDVVIPSHADETIAHILATLKQNNVSNFVVKLVDHWVAWQWKSVHTVGSHSLRTCSCRPAIHSSSSAAYIIDKHAAHTLLDYAFPASMHVDSYIHDVGCNKKLINLFQVYPHLAHYTNRPSVHMRNTSFHRAFLLVKEIISNTLASTC